jgi:hypothetical protein
MLKDQDGQEVNITKLKKRLQKGAIDQVEINLSAVTHFYENRDGDIWHRMYGPHVNPEDSEWHRDEDELEHFNAQVQNALSVFMKKEGETINSAIDKKKLDQEAKARREHGTPNPLDKYERRGGM